jgi:hypothetical protein
MFNGVVVTNNGVAIAVAVANTTQPVRTPKSFRSQSISRKVCLP